MSPESDKGNAPLHDEPAIPPLPQQYGLGIPGKAALASGVAILSAVYPPAAIPLAGAGAALQAVGERLNTLQHVRTSELLASASAESPSLRRKLSESL